MDGGGLNLLLPHQPARVVRESTLVTTKNRQVPPFLPVATPFPLQGAADRLKSSTRDIGYSPQIPSDKGLRRFAA